jgi:hypothetical protein
MITRKAIALAGLVLAVAVLSPAAAQAKKGGTDRPVKVSQSGTTTFTPTSAAGGTLFTEQAGIASHGGAATSTFNGTLTFTSLSTFTFTGPATLVVANGDELFGDLSGTGTQTPSGSELVVGFTITGGTGRFEDASGTLTGTTTNVLVSPGPPSVFDTEGSLKGKISY